MALDLKALFGDKDSLTLEELTTATAGMKLVDLKEGGYVDEAKFLKAEKALKDAKTAADDATKELNDLKAANEGDDAPSKQLEAAEARIAEAEKRIEAAEARATAKERESLVADKVASPKLRRLLKMDAEAFMADDPDLTFEDAVAKAIEADPDYAPSDDDAGAPPSTFTARTGDETRGKPAKVDDLKAAVDAEFARAKPAAVATT